MEQWMILAPILLGAVSAVLTRVVRDGARRRRLYDNPNERSAHVLPTPRLGGIGVMTGFLPAAFAVAWREGADGPVFVALAATMVISATGLWDDLRPLPARTRFGVQTAAAAVVTWVSRGNLPEAWTLFGAHVPQWLLAILSVLWIVWLTNLYNFMDGIDGLAAGQAIIAGAAIGLVGFGAAPVQAMLAVLLASAAAGFLLFNFPPASIFMGDVGSTAIGFFFASVPLITPSGLLPVEVVGIGLALFILDATTTLIRRLSRGERFFQAHRTHFYQRPLSLGVGHRTVTLAAYAGMVAVAGAATAWLRVGFGVRLALIAGAVLLFCGYAAAVMRLERRARKAPR